MKRFLPFLAFCFTGCAFYDAKLPEVSASEVHIKHVDMAGSVTIDAMGVTVTPNEVKAVKYTRIVGYPFTHDEVEIKDYSRNRSKNSVVNDTDAGHK